MSEKRQIVLVLGMHRSGTSSIATKIKQLGYAGGISEIEKNSFNPNGYNEDARIVKLHVNLLASFNRQWGFYQHWLALPDNWLEHSATKLAYDRIKEIIEHTPERRTFFKDPRMVVFIELWQKVLDDLKIDYKIVVIVRNKKSVVQSLVKRDKFSEELAGALYEYYNYLLVEKTADSYALFLDFEDYAKNEAGISDRLASFLQIENHGPPSIFDERLDHGTDQEIDSLFGVGINQNHPSAALLSQAKDYLEKHRQYTDLHSEFNLKSMLASDSWRLTQDLNAFRARAEQMEKAYHTAAHETNLYKERAEQMEKAYHTAVQETNLYKERAEQMEKAYHTAAQETNLYKERAEQMNTGFVKIIKSMIIRQAKKVRER